MLKLEGNYILLFREGGLKLLGSKSRIGRKGVEGLRCSTVVFRRRVLLMLPV